MRRRRKKHSQLSVSLFPFLAVLICTLGVLIVMLVMAVKSADVRADQSQTEDQQEKQTEIDRLQDLVDVKTLQIEGLQYSRPDILARLNDSRNNRSYIQDEIRKLKEEFKRLGDELVAMQQEPDPQPEDVESFSEAEADAELELLKQEVAKAESDLKSKRKSALEDGATKYVIVPHKGGGGTLRRPIYLECSHDAITIQPSGIRLEMSEFAPPLEAGNMLDSALLAIREYWQRYDLAGKHGSPYPLIVIRPDGAESFVLARRAMKSWDDEFGYELVEADKSLDFGETDPQLEVEVRDAILEARRRQYQRQAQLAAQRRMAARFESSGERPGLTASNRRGGFVSSGNQSDSYGGPANNRQHRSGNSFVGHGNLDYAASDYDDSFIGEGTSLDHFRDKRQRSGGRFQGTAHQGSTHPNGNQQGQSTSQLADSGNVGIGKAIQSRGAAGQGASPQQGPSSQGNGNQSQAGQGMSAAASPKGDNAESNQVGEINQGTPHSGQCIATERGRNWALPSQTPGATGYLRPIRVVCADRYLDVVSGSGSTKRIPLKQQTIQSVDPLIDEIWKQIESWGISGANSYWKPQLRFTVKEGGQQRFAELKSLLDQSGLVIEEQRR